MMWHFFCCLLPYSKQQGKRKEKNEENSTMMIIIINYCDVRLLKSYACILHVHFSYFLYWQNVSIDYMCQLPWRPLCSHTHPYIFIYSLSLSCLLAFFFSLTYSSSSFHLIVHPHNFLIRFAGRTREHSAARPLLFFFASERKRTPSLLHYSGTSFLSSSFASSPSSSSSPFHTHTTTHTSHKWSAVENWVEDNCRRRSTFYVCICSTCFLSYCVLETHSNISMSSLLHFYRTRSATTINQLKPLQRIRSHSPDDVLLRQTVIYSKWKAYPVVLLLHIFFYRHQIFLLLFLQSNLFPKPVTITTNDNKASHLVEENEKSFFSSFFRHRINTFVSCVIYRKNGFKVNNLLFFLFMYVLLKKYGLFFQPHSYINNHRKKRKTHNCRRS